jgi:hypothetical protein
MSFSTRWDGPDNLRDAFLNVELAASAFIESAKTEGATIEAEAEVLAHELMKLPENANQSAGGLREKATATARQNYATRRAQAAAAIATQRDAIIKGLDDVDRYQKSVKLEPPTVTREDAAWAYQSDREVLLEQRRTQRSIDVLTVVTEYGAIRDVQELLSALEREEASSNLVAADYLDRKIGQLLEVTDQRLQAMSAHERAANEQIVSQHQRDRERFEALRDKRMPATLRDSVQRRRAELTAATAKALELAAEEQLRFNPFSDAAVDALFKAGRARRAAGAVA